MSSLIWSKQLKVSLNIWSVLSLIFILILILPNINILLNVFNESNANWVHIKTYLLKEYITNTIILVFFTGILSAVIGTGLAWLVSVYDFPLRSFLKWGLILPFAIPPYIAAYTYKGMLGYTGVLQVFLRENLGIKIDQKWVDIMSLEGAILIFVFFLYPYVYAISRSFLEKQSASLIENARLLGRSPFVIFWRVVLPLSRAAIIGGVSLVILEVLNDYGVVNYFGVTTFSTAIFRTWFALGDLDSAIKLAGLLMIIVFSVLLLEKLTRGRKKYSFTTTKVRPISRIKLTGWEAALAFTFAFGVFSLGFLIPTLQLIHWAFLTYATILNASFFTLVLNSVLVALVASILIMLIAVIIANYARISDGIWGKIYARMAVIGYSIPGAIIGIGVIVFFVGIDRALYPVYQFFNPNTIKLVLSTSIIMLIFAYTIRFIAIGFNSVEAGFEKVGRKFFEASRTLGFSPTKTFLKVDLWMIKPAMFSGFILAFVDIMKELPLALILRPFNFDTLATKAYQYANDEMIHEASIASLLIILISFASIWFFQLVIEKEVDS
ncbi:MAG: iron ABC transporter permease [Carboxydocellales bacterium]